ncbi:MAG: ribonuclease P protein component [Epulopiscium sp. Nuni2H_MBin001]|nr:MAG: ribonuclease P protein component [Epulopiscium sp. Nuni2H_MBin001]
MKTIKKKYEFTRVYKYGKSYANNYLVMYKLKNNCSTNRIGISVSKKVGNSVVRSRITRLIKENLRLINIENIGWDIVIIARADAKDKDFYEIKNSIEKLLIKHKFF